MARPIAVEVLLNATSYARGLRKATEETELFGTTATRSFEHVGRSLALMTGGFVAFSGATEFLRASIDAARDAGVANRSLAAQMKASGQSFTDNSGAVDKAEQSLAKFGFTSEDSTKALTVLERGTGNITRAISLQGVAANLARAKNLDLADAANILAKVFGGQETALRRAVPGLAKHEHGLQLIADAEKRLAGQAAAGTTEAEKFHAILHNTEVIVGDALLPTINKLLRSLGDWLDKMNRSGKLQQDVNDAVRTGTTLFNDAKGALDGLNRITGSTKHSLELLFGAFVAFKTAEFATTFLKIAAQIGATGTAAKTATPFVARLGLAFKLGIAAGVIAAGYELSTFIRKIPGWDSTMRDFGGTLYDVASKLGVIGDLTKGTITQTQARAQYSKIANTFGTSFANEAVSGPGSAYQNVLDFVGSAARGATRAGSAGPSRLSVPGARGSATLNLNAPLTADQQRAIGLAGDPRNLALLRQQAAHDQAALDFAKKLRTQGRISNATYVKEVTAYASDLQQTNSTITGILQAASDARKQAAKTAADNRKAAAQAAKDRAALAQQNLFDRLQLSVDKTGLTDTLSDDLKALEKYQAVVKNIIRTQGSTLALQQQLLGVETNIKSVQDQITSNRKQAADARRQEAKQAAADAKAAADAAKQRAKNAAAAALARRDAIQFRLLGLGPTGGALVPGAANLQKRLAGVRDAVKGTFLDTSKTGAELDRIAKILAGKFGKVSEGVRSAIDQMYKDIRDKLKTSSQLVRSQRVSSQNFVDSLGLNLTGNEKRRIEAQFARIGPAGTAPAGRPAAFVINGDMHFHGVQDIPGLENEFAKRTKARGHVRRGSR